MAGCTVRRYEQLETSPETIEQELRPAVCEHRQTDRRKENYGIDVNIVINECYDFRLNNGSGLLITTMYALLARDVGHCYM